MRFPGLFGIARVEPAHDVYDRLRVDVGRGRDAAGRAEFERLDQRQLRSRIDDEPVDAEQRSRVVPFARAVLDADHLPGEFRVQPPDQ